ncbi:MAG: type II toxin-antitoxin system Phd/YefM family antitoxin [Gemmatimonadetes bacterium]|nr:type II toxin-antitoxin system Phd/YefM family antitoxin [Gemmatimonadota bacterium]
MTRVAASKLRTTISDVLDRVVHHGERIAVERYGKPVAALVSPEDLELLEAIEDRIDIEAARKALREPGRRRWDEVRAELALQDDPAS